MLVTSLPLTLPQAANLPGGPSYHSKPEDMILGNLLLLVLSLFSASVFAEESDSVYDGTRIANRTIERVRLPFLSSKHVLNIL